MYVSKVSDSRRFSKTIKPRFSSKWKTENTVILTLGDTILQNEKLKVNTLCFADITKAPKLKRHLNCDGHSLSTIIKYFKNNKSNKN